MNSLLILGAGGHSKVVAETALASGGFSRVAFLDDRYDPHGAMVELLGWPIKGSLAGSLDPNIREQYHSAFVAIGNPAIRLVWFYKLVGLGYHLPALVHPSAWVSPSAHIDSCSVICAQAAVQANSLIGSGSILNTGCSIDHDVSLACGVHICPGARLAGEVLVGDRSWIGIGASIIQQIRIGSDVIIGAGAAVVSDMPDGVTAVGVPARILP